MTTPCLFPIGARVTIQGLSKAPEYNGKCGIVISGNSSSTEDIRQQVEISLDTQTKKILGLKLCNLEYERIDIPTLSIKELKKVLILHNGTDATSLTGLDANELRKQVSEIPIPQFQQYIATMNAETLSVPKATRASTTTTSAAAAAATSIPGVDNDLLKQQASQISNMSTEQLQQQAQMLKNMDPATLRRMNPAVFAHLTDEQIKQQMEFVTNNPHTLKQAAQKVQENNISLPTTASSSPTSAPTATPTPGFPSPPPGMNMANMMENLSPEQLLQQVQMMKSMSLSSIRSMNPAFTNMTDQQINASIQQMEMMASNPALFDMAKQQMKNLSPQQIQNMQQMQNNQQQQSSSSSSSSATTPASPNGDTMMDTSNIDPMTLLDNMDGKQLKQMITMMRSNPDLLSQQFGAGGNAEQQKTQIENTLAMFDKLSEKQLDIFLKVIKFINNYILLPTKKVYNQLKSNKNYVFYIAAIFGLILAIYISNQYMNTSSDTTTTAGIQKNNIFQATTTTETVGSIHMDVNPPVLSQQQQQQQEQAHAQAQTQPVKTSSEENGETIDENSEFDEFA